MALALILTQIIIIGISKIVINIEQNTTTKFYLAYSTDKDNLLLEFINRNTNSKNYCIVTPIKDYRQYMLLTVTENDTEDNINGILSLTPSGGWDLKIYGQNSSINLNPDNAELIAEEQVNIIYANQNEILI